MSRTEAWGYSGEMGKQTGPTSRDGKASSSQNAMKHGLRAKTLIIGDERQEDFDELEAGWRAEYEDEGQAVASLLKRVILADWFLQRAERRYAEAEAEAAENALGWTEEQHAKIERFLRYKTTHERSFFRALSGLRGLRKDKIREELDYKKMSERADEIMREAFLKAESEAVTRESEAKKAESATPVKRSVEVFGSGAGRSSGKGAKNGGKKRELVVLDQWVEVEIEDGRTVTKLYPTNEELIKEGQKKEQIPDYVYRRINFPNGIPEEYTWTAPENAERRERGGMGTQRMTADTWLEAIEREAASGTGHVGPTGVGNLPRPKERGGCECEVCAQNREILESRAGE